MIEYDPQRPTPRPRLKKKRRLQAANGLIPEKDLMPRSPLPPLPPPPRLSSNELVKTADHGHRKCESLGDIPLITTEVVPPESGPSSLVDYYLPDVTRVTHTSRCGSALSFNALEWSGIINTPNRLQPQEWQFLKQKESDAEEILEVTSGFSDQSFMITTSPSPVPPDDCDLNDDVFMNKNCKVLIVEKEQKELTNSISSSVEVYGCMESSCNAPPPSENAAAAAVKTEDCDSVSMSDDHTFSSVLQENNTVFECSTQPLIAETPAQDNTELVEAISEERVACEDLEIITQEKVACKDGTDESPVNIVNISSDKITNVFQPPISPDRIEDISSKSPELLIITDSADDSSDHTNQNVEGRNSPLLEEKEDHHVGNGSFLAETLKSEEGNSIDAGVAFSESNAICAKLPSPVCEEKEKKILDLKETITADNTPQQDNSVSPLSPCRHDKTVDEPVNASKRFSYPYKSLSNNLMGPRPFHVFLESYTLRTQQQQQKIMSRLSISPDYLQSNDDGATLSTEALKSQEVTEKTDGGLEACRNKPSFESSCTRLIEVPSTSLTLSPEIDCLLEMEKDATTEVLGNTTKEILNKQPILITVTEVSRSDSLASDESDVLFSQCDGEKSEALLVDAEEDTVSALPEKAPEDLVTFIESKLSGESCPEPDTYTTTTLCETNSDTIPLDSLTITNYIYDDFPSSDEICSPIKVSTPDICLAIPKVIVAPVSKSSWHSEVVSVSSYGDEWLDPSDQWLKKMYSPELKKAPVEEDWSAKKFKKVRFLDAVERIPDTWPCDVEGEETNAEESNETLQDSCQDDLNSNCQIADGKMKSLEGKKPLNLTITSWQPMIVATI